MAATLPVSGCMPPRTTLPRALPAEFSLELAGEYILPRGAKVPGSEDLTVGGLSGLALDPRTGRLLAVSDGRDPGRVFEFDIAGEGASFTVRPTRAIRLRNDRRAPALIDPEAIVLTGRGELLIASEGDGDVEPRVPPSLLLYDRSGRFRRALPLPPKFVPTPLGPLREGPRHNEAFESLTATWGDQRLFTAVESPLVQDGEPAAIGRGAHTRILEYVATGGGWAPRREFFYPLDPVAATFRPAFLINGLVELLAVGDDLLLALERSFATEGDGGRQFNQIRLYRVSLADAEDVSADHLPGATSRHTVLAKTLVLDLSAVRGLSPGLAALDNFEGLAFGPRLSDGSPSLLLVSDDNFNERQQTAFLQFRIRPRGSS